MPEPLSEAAARRVEELLREGLSAVEVSRALHRRWPLVTPARVRMEAYRPIGPPRGRRLAAACPAWADGREGAEQPYRDRARELREQVTVCAASRRSLARNGCTITAGSNRKLR